MKSVSGRIRHIGKCALISLVLGVAGLSAARADTYASDLDIFLVNGATSIQLFAGDKYFIGTTGYLETIFDDESANPPLGSPFYEADMAPVDALAGFIGASLAGTWSLHILDNFLPGDGDVLNAWSIFGSTDEGDFDIAGPGKEGVDSDPETIVSLSTALLGRITDINVRVLITDISLPDDGGPAEEIPTPGALAIFGSGLGALGLCLRRRKPYNLGL